VTVFTVRLGEHNFIAIIIIIIIIIIMRRRRSLRRRRTRAHYPSLKLYTLALLLLLRI